MYLRMLNRNYNRKKKTEDSERFKKTQDRICKSFGFQYLYKQNKYFK